MNSKLYHVDIYIYSCIFIYWCNDSKYRVEVPAGEPGYLGKRREAGGGGEPGPGTEAGGAAGGEEWRGKRGERGGGGRSTTKILIRWADGQLGRGGAPSCHRGDLARDTQAAGGSAVAHWIGWLTLATKLGFPQTAPRRNKELNTKIMTTFTAVYNMSNYH